MTGQDTLPSQPTQEEHPQDAESEPPSDAEGACGGQPFYGRGGDESPGDSILNTCPTCGESVPDWCMEAHKLFHVMD